MTLKLGTEIPGTSAEGNITTIWVPAIKNIKAPTIIELEAGTDISNYVMLGGWSFDPLQDTVSDQRENTVQDFGAPGRKHGHRRAIGLRPEAHRREREVRRKEGHQPGGEHHDPQSDPAVRSGSRLGVRDRRAGRSLTSSSVRGF